MSWIITIAAIILLAVLPVGIRAVYNSSGAVAHLIVGPVRIKIYPGRKTTAGRNKRRGAKASENDDFESKKSGNKRKGGKLSDFLSVLQFIFEFLSDFRRKLRVNRLELKLILCGDDPCDLSVNYGRAWAALGGLMPQLERLFVIKKRNLEVECDFTSADTLIEARIDMTITVGKLLSIVGYHGVRGLRKYYKLLKEMKGGAMS